MSTETKYSHSLKLAHLQANYPEARIDRTGEYTAWVSIDKAVLNGFASYCIKHDIEIDLEGMSNYDTPIVDFELFWI